MNYHFTNIYTSIRKKKYFYLLLVLFIISCKEKKSADNPVKQKPKLSVVHKYSLTEPLESSSMEKIISWKEYNSLDSLLNKFYSISADEALNNALELSSLIKLLKKNISPKDLITPAFKVRINVLENEILRLEDMTYISAITTNEVNYQIKKIIEAYSATNSKINAIYSQIELEEELGIEINIIELDTLN